MEPHEAAIGYRLSAVGSYRLTGALWAHDSRQHESRKRLDALRALHERLRTTFLTVEAIGAWTHSDNAYLGGLKPVEALHVGHIDAVDAALEALDSGIFV